jgi:hypothetical protein
LPRFFHVSDGNEFVRDGSGSDFPDEAAAIECATAPVASLNIGASLRFYVDAGDQDERQMAKNLRRSEAPIASGASDRTGVSQIPDAALFE